MIPRYSKQILPGPWPFVKSKFDCTILNFYIFTFLTQTALKLESLYLQEANRTLAKHISNVAPLPASPNMCS